MNIKRVFDIIASGVGLIILLPIFFVVALLIKVNSKGPVFFRQERVGLRGEVFRIHKFRTMHVEQPNASLQITVGRDPRITSIGHFLRRYKIDELPQLLDVLRGCMSLVGPRPEVPKYVEYYPVGVREVVLSVRPGITDWASIKYKDENRILGSASDPERAYIEQILPIKLKYYVEYVEQRSLHMDIKIIVFTIFSVLN